MKKLILAIFMFASAMASAEAVCPNNIDLVDHFLKGFAKATPLSRASAVNRLCTFLLPINPTCTSKDYAGDIRRLGDAYKTNPEAAYMALDTCQNLWNAKFMDPLKAKIVTTVHQQDRVFEMIASQGLLEGTFQYLAERISIWGQVEPGHSAGSPPAPFEILSGMAASERQLDITLTNERNKATAAFAGTSLTAGAGIIWTIADIVRGTSMSAGRFVKQALILTAAAWLITVEEEFRAANAGKAEERLRMKYILAQLKYPDEFKDNPVPRPMLFDQLYKSTTLLGFYSNKDLYDAQGGEDNHALPDWECYRELKGYLEAPNKTDDEQLSWIFNEGATCGDAANLKISAGLYLRQYFAADPQAQVLATKMISEGKRLFQFYQQSIQYWQNVDACEQRAWDLRLLHDQYKCDGINGKVGGGFRLET